MENVREILDYIGTNNISMLPKTKKTSYSTRSLASSLGLSSKQLNDYFIQLGIAYRLNNKFNFNADFYFQNTDLISTKKHRWGTSYSFTSNNINDILNATEAYKSVKDSVLSLPLVEDLLKEEEGITESICLPKKFIPYKSNFVMTELYDYIKTNRPNTSDDNIQKIMYTILRIRKEYLKNNTKGGNLINKIGFGLVNLCKVVNKELARFVWNWLKEKEVFINEDRSYFNDPAKINSFQIQYKIDLIKLGVIEKKFNIVDPIDFDEKFESELELEYYSIVNDQVDLFFPYHMSVSTTGRVYWNGTDVKFEDLPSIMKSRDGSRLVEADASMCHFKLLLAHMGYTGIFNNYTYDDFNKLFQVKDIKMYFMTHLLNGTIGKDKIEKLNSIDSTFIDKYNEFIKIGSPQAFLQRMESDLFITLAIKHNLMTRHDSWLTTESNIDSLMAAIEEASDVYDNLKFKIKYEERD